MDIKVINFNAHHTSQRISMDMFFFEAITKVHSNTLTKMWYKLIPEYPNRCKFVCLYQSGVVFGEDLRKMYDQK